MAMQDKRKNLFPEQDTGGGKKNSPFKIAIIGSAHPLRGGLAAYNERIAYAFASEGHQVTIYSFSLQYPNFLFPGKSQYSTAPAPAGLDIRTCINSVNPFNWIRIGRKLKKEKPDLVIIKYWLPFMGPCFGTILRILKRNRHSRVICIVDNMVPHEHRPGDRLFTRYFVKPVDAFVAMSRQVLADIGLFDQKKPRSFCPHPLYDHFGKIIPAGEAKKHLGLDPSYNYLLFFGLIRDYKGLDWLIEAFADERLRVFPLKLLVAGEYYTDPAPYQELIKKYGLEDRVISTNDFVPDDKVADYFCAADMVVQPYKSATQSGVTQIAYHFNKPMLVTDVGGLAEIIPDKKVGYVVRPEPAAIADALVDFYSSDRAAAFTEGVKEEKKKYEWSRMTGTVYELFNSLKS